MTADEFQQYEAPAKNRLTAAMKKAWGLSLQEARVASSAAFEKSAANEGNEAENQGTFVIEAERRAVGVLWFAIQSIRGFREVYVLDLFIYPNERRCGFATAALQELEQIARKVKARRICLNVFGQNVNATKFYEMNGFETASRSLIRPVPTIPRRPQKFFGASKRGQPRRVTPI